NGQPVPVIMTVTVNFRLDADGNPRPFIPPPPPPPPPGLQASVQAPPPPPPAPPAPPAPAYQEPVRVGGNIKEPKKIKHVAPVYPPEAQESRIQGIVILEALIDPDGKVASARVIRGVNGLDDAAVDAVLQWEFTPTLLNGQPVPVIMTVTVNFTLQ
ncbi:MAG: energy transducer TonB, partial [Acidobacteria bacterium]|nr:energy transducer TonB [Acidobacteriota bacterium]